jgi:polysaccharide export outer membrane protein
MEIGHQGPRFFRDKHTQNVTPGSPNMIHVNLTIEGEIQVTHSWFSIVAAAALLISFSGAGLCQVNMPVSGSQKSTSVSRSGAAAPGSNSGLTTVPEDFVKLRLAPGFMLSLNVLDDSDFVGTFRVDELGDISLPILGTMHVAGETVAEARVQLEKRLLDGGFLKDPQISLTVVEYTAPEVTIIGEVAEPGKYPLLAPRKLVDVLALSGGTTLTAGNEVQITHGSATTQPVVVHYSRKTNPKAIEDVIVQPGDTVQVARAGIVYVLGAVTRPGGFVMQEEGTLNVLQAVALAYGTTLLASTSTIYIVRRNANGTAAYIKVPYKKLTRGRGADVQLHASDVLFVPTSAVKSVYFNTQQIMNAAATSAIYVGLGS